MGACASKKSEDKINSGTNYSSSLRMSNKNENVYGIKKLGTSVIPIQTSESPLKFEFRVSNIRGKNFPENKYYLVKIIFENSKNTFILPLSSGKNPHFNFEKYLRLEIPFENLEKTYFELIVYSLSIKTDIIKIKDWQGYLTNEHIMSSLKVDLLTIAIGPEHHDIRLLDRNNINQIGRISFNISCFHMENVFLNIQTLEFKISHLVNKQIALKLAFNNMSHSIESEYTLPIDPNMNNKEEVTTYKWVESLNPISINNHDRNGQNKINNLSLELKLSMVDLRSSNISLNVYDLKYVDAYSLPQSDDINAHKEFNAKRVSMTGQDMVSGHDVELIAKYTQIGYSNFNFYKILSENDNIITKQSSTFFNLGFSGNNEPEAIPNQVIKFKIFDNVLKTFHEKIFWEGKEVGKVEGIIEIKKIPLIRQVMCGVHTESGFDISSVYLNLESAKTLQQTDYNTSPSELKTLALQKNNLLQSFLKLTGLTYSASRDLTNQILDSMKNIANTLEKSFKESCLYYNYHSNRDLYNSQKIMLDIGINIIKLMESFDLEQRAKGFKILYLLNNRAEFDLGTLWRAWFLDQGSDSVFRDSYLIDEKIIENFIHFNNLCLNFSLDGLSRGGTLADKEARTFVEFFLSVAYFRIPKVRNTFLNIISTGLYKEKEYGDDLRNDRNNIKEFIEMDPVNSLILWENLFYKRLDSALNSYKSSNKIDENELNDRLKDTDIIINKDHHKGEWKERLRKRGPAFFSMIVRLENYISHKVVKEINIKWLNIPGFNIIIDAIVNELKIRDVSAYPKKLCDLILIFTNDFEIINNFVSVIIGRTNAHDANAVFNLVNMLESIFSDSKFKKKANNTRFDYSILKRAVILMLDLDHCLAISKFLKLYYNNTSLMNFDHVAEIYIYIHQNKFFAFFFHWSWQLRNVFYHIILYIINFQIRSSDFISTDNSWGRRKSFGEIKEVSNYSEILRTNLLSEFNKKMKVVEMIKQHIKTMGLDPSYNTMVDAWNKPEFREIPDEYRRNIILAMTHFEIVEKQFKKWEDDNKRKKFADQLYPVVEIQPPKDDVVEYSETW